MSDLQSKDNCAGRYPALWRIRYEYTECTGEFVTRVRQFDVVALSEGLALAAFNEEHSPVIYTRLTNPERVCYVDAIVATVHVS